MQGLLDEELLAGAHEARITYRPAREAVPLPTSGGSSFLQTLAFNCQLWGGAGFPIIPLNPDHLVDATYARALSGAAIDHLLGTHPFDLVDLEGITVKADAVDRSFGAQLAVALLEHKQQDKYKVLEVVSLSAEDPWRGIYAACLGALDDAPDARVLKSGDLIPTLRFEDFVRVKRENVVGSLSDLMQRLTSDEHTTPRRLSMIHLAYGNSGSASLRDRDEVLPEPWFKSYDAGPNVVVVCSPGNNDDLALLWNLRAAHGDSRVAPIGLPLAEFNIEAIHRLRDSGNISLHGSAARLIYVTSASVSTVDIGKVVGQDDQIGVGSVAEMLTFGFPGGWHRDEVLQWNDGRTRFVALRHDDHREIFEERAIGRMTRMHYDLEVLDSPFPTGAGTRSHAPNGLFQNGALSSWGTPPNRSDVRDLRWPSRLLMARSVAAKRDLELAESEPGRSARLALVGMESLGWVGNLAHAPLLALLEGMAARQGFGWYKQRLRAHGEEPDTTAVIGPTTDELPERSFSDFKRALGNNEKATKYWMLWAERAKLLLKGFQLQCPNCLAKQWVPVAAFAPPIVCRGCAEEMDTPFNDRPAVDFKFRLSERLRRVYEHDAMGHLLVASYLDSLMGGRTNGRLIGLHPGMEVRKIGSETVLGEADVLMLTRHGEFIPTEVKRTASGLTEAEITKLDTLVGALNSPWSIVAFCEYAIQASEDASKLIDKPGPYRRIVLSYDALLDPHAMWGMGQDPFAWQPLDAAQISERESKFVAGLARRAASGPFDWTESDMLRQRDRPGAANPK